VGVFPPGDGELICDQEGVFACDGLMILRIIQHTNTAYRHGLLAICFLPAMRNSAFMNDDHKPPPRPHFFESLPGSIQEAVNSGRQHAENLSKQLRGSHPAIAESMDMAQQSFQRTVNHGKGEASRHLDAVMQTASLKMSQYGRESFKMKPEEGDWLPTRIKKQAVNYVVDKAADNVDFLIRGTKDFASGVADKVVSGTVDRFGPSNLSPFIYQPDAVKKYGAQFGEKLTTLPRAFNDPLGFTKEWAGKKMTTARNIGGLAGELEGGSMKEKLTHGGRGLVDFAQEEVAPVVGAGIIAKGLYSGFSSTRNNTRTAMDSIFPSSSAYGRVARMQPFRFFIATSVARVAGNPRLSAMLLGYGAVTGIGSRILDSYQLAKEDPVASARLAAEHRDMLDSSTLVNARASLRNTTKPK
jgi:hypothetical protein